MAEVVALPQALPPAQRQGSKARTGKRSVEWLDSPAVKEATKLCWVGVMGVLEGRCAPPPPACESDTPDGPAPPLLAEFQLWLAADDRGSGKSFAPNRMLPSTFL